MRTAKMTLASTALATAFVCAGLTNTARAEVVIEHIGANDPVTEGWTANFPSGPVFAGPVFNDQGSGLDAWFIDDNGSESGNRGTYFRILTAAQISQGETFGWTLSTRLRIVEFPDPAPGDPPTLPGFSVDGAPVIAYRNGTTDYAIAFGAQADGDPILNLFTKHPPSGSSIEIILEGEGSGYHLYELVFDPDEGDIDLFIDGVERLNGYSGAPLAVASPRVIFGAGDSQGLGEGNFNLVRFEVAPITDTDADGVPDTSDNCPNDANPGQENNDGDAEGNICDPDDDNDGVLDADPDNCPFDVNPLQEDNEGDGIGDICDPDDDNDTVADDVDNCPAVPNPGQEQTGNNVGGPFGDACVDPGASVGEDVTVGDNFVVGQDTTIGDGTTIGDDFVADEEVTVGENVDIGNDTSVGEGSTIGDGSVLGDMVMVGQDTTIGPGVIIGDRVTIGDGVVIKAGATIGDDAEIGDGATIGMNATVSAGAMVPPGAKIKNGATFP